MTSFNTILFYVIPYLSFMALLWLSKEKKGLRLFDENGFVANPHILIIMHIGGIILFGLPLLPTSHYSSYVYLNSDGFKSVPFVITVFFVLVFIVFSIGR